ncbi:hypothetical protein [Pseudoalteromonas rubra]|uniref:hypothetical protein n=1 Tax=Pseudoalteromonas rubra TaxID=43658 RepID=UPI000B0FDDC0|nr:hypothetical protein [Pseudoalteromonas rubra]
MKIAHQHDNVPQVAANNTSAQPERTLLSLRVILMKFIESVTGQLRSNAEVKFSY